MKARRAAGIGLVVTLGISGCAEMRDAHRPLTEVVEIKAGERHTCAVSSTGGVKCWGFNHDGQVGDGTGQDHASPVDVVGLGRGVKAIAAGWRHTCAVTAAGTAMCWGNNRDGQLGDGSRLDRNAPQEVVGLMIHVKTLAVGERHTCAVTVAGGVKCWGNNEDGELGDGSREDRVTPVEVAGLASGVKAISAGWRHTCALLETGGIRCWGNNHDGQLGDGTEIHRVTPVEVAGLTSGVVAIGARFRQTCAVTTAGALKCWGNNHDGQLGDGSRKDQSTPVDVTGLSNGVKAVAVGWRHVCGLLEGGGIKCWGSNHEGQLGDGTGVDRKEPVDVVGFPGQAEGLAAGGQHTCALARGGVTCWGENEDGQLGDGTFRSTLSVKAEPSS